MTVDRTERLNLRRANYDMVLVHKCFVKFRTTLFLRLQYYTNVHLQKFDLSGPSYVL
jgi:hypothetical protein